MKAASFLMSLFLAAGALGAQDAKTIADNLDLPAIQPGDTAIPVPQVEGAEVSLFCVDYEQVFDRTGKLVQGKGDVPIKVAYKVLKGNDMAISKDYHLVVPAARQAEGGNPKPELVPDILQWKGGEGSYTLGGSIGVYDDSLKDMAGMLAEDIKDLLGKEIPMAAGGPASSISLLLSPARPHNQGMEEAYWIVITPERIAICAHTRQGLYWGTRTVLQLLKKGNGTIPCGEILDYPRYKVRGFMLDIARTPVPMDVLKDVVRTMAWYKMNDLHLVINNNFIFHEKYVDAGKDPFKESYSAFRLESDMKGADGTPLTAQDLYYTKKEFMELVQFAKERGVTIVPEFDMPGHALSFTRVRPDLIYQGPMNNAKRRCEMLDAGNPEAVAFAGKVYDEFLLPDERLGGKAVFEDCPVMHVGADEFYGEKEAYRAFADGVLRHVLNRKHTPRIWGSLRKKPGWHPVASKGVQVNLWSSGWAKAWETIDQGYDVINTNDGFLYIVPYANYYRMDKCHPWFYANFKPNCIGEETLPAGHPNLLGSTFAVWQDMTDLLHNGYCMYDIWPSIAFSMDIMSQKVWGPEEMPRTLEQHRALAVSIGEAPGLQIHHRTGAAPFSVQPESLPMDLGKQDLGPAYHLEMEVELAEVKDGEEQVLLSGPQGELLAVMEDGTVGFRRSDTMTFTFGAKLPVGKKVKLELIGRPCATTLLIDGQPAGTTVLKSFHDNKEDLVSTFILPLQTIGKSFKGKVHSMSVKPSAE